MPRMTEANDDSLPHAPEVSGELPAGGLASTPFATYWFWIVLLLVCWQPLELGFYMDDWAAQAETARNGAAFSKQLFDANLTLDRSRPGLAVIRYAASSVLGDRPLLWQLAMLLSNALVAVWLGRAAQAVLGLGGRGFNPVARSIGLLWLLLPWSASSQFWTGLLPQELVLALFAYLITRIFARRSPALLDSVVDGLLYLWICVSYEAFYGQFVAVVLVCIALALLGRMRLRAVVFNFTSLAAAQVLAIGWYFASGKVTTAQRGIYHGWMALVLQNLTGIVPQMALSAAETRWALYLSFLSLLACVGWILSQSRGQWGDRRRILSSTLVVLACGLGALLSVVSFSRRPAHERCGR